jgi:hypothetical protein
MNILIYPQNGNFVIIFIESLFLVFQEASQLCLKQFCLRSKSMVADNITYKAFGMPHAPPCPTMSHHAPPCPTMPHHAPPCPTMPHHAPPCPMPPAHGNL